MATNQTAGEASASPAGGLAMFQRLWDESWGVGIWCAPWEKAVAGLTPEQAAWSPGGGRHSIWQNVVHVSVWRELTLTRVDGRPGPRREEMEALNFQSPAAVSPEAWNAAIARLKKTHVDMAEAIRSLIGADPLVRGSAAERLAYHLAHDTYHLGQIMQNRAALGLPPIE